MVSGAEERDKPELRNAHGFTDLHGSPPANDVIVIVRRRRPVDIKRPSPATPFADTSGPRKRSVRIPRLGWVGTKATINIANECAKHTSVYAYTVFTKSLEGPARNSRARESGFKP